MEITEQRLVNRINSIVHFATISDSTKIKMGDTLEGFAAELARDYFVQYPQKNDADTVYMTGLIERNLFQDVKKILN